MEDTKCGSVLPGFNRSRLISTLFILTAAFPLQKRGVKTTALQGGRRLQPRPLKKSMLAILACFLLTVPA